VSSVTVESVDLSISNIRVQFTLVLVIMKLKRFDMLSVLKEWGGRVVQLLGSSMSIAVESVCLFSMYGLRHVRDASTGAGHLRADHS